MKRKRIILKKYYWTISAIIFAGIFFALGFFYQFSYRPKLHALPEMFTEAKTALLSVKANNKNNLPKAKKTTNETNDTSPPVKFEFYSTLPQMQVADVPATSKSHAAQKILGDPAALEHSLLAAIKQETFYIQLKLFQEKETALEKRQALVQAGYQVMFEKVYVDEKNQAYRIKLGPFTSQAEANSILLRLQKTGYDGRIRQG